MDEKRKLAIQIYEKDKEVEKKKMIFFWLVFLGYTAFIFSFLYFNE